MLFTQLPAVLLAYFGIQKIPVTLTFSENDWY